MSKQLPIEQTHSQWTRRPDDPRWYWEIRFDSDDEQSPSGSGFSDGPGLNVLDEVVRELPELIYRSPDEPSKVTIILDSIPF